MFVQNHTGSVSSLFQKFTGAYRYGFNGKEKVDEVAGNGNTYDYGFRIYNAQLGRFLSVDPLTSKFPMLTPYQFASNRPIDGVDLDGLEFSKTTTYDEKTGTTYIHITVKVKVINNQTMLTNEQLDEYLKISQEQFSKVMDVCDEQNKIQYSGSLIFDDKGTIKIVPSNPRVDDASMGFAIPGISVTDVGDNQYNTNEDCEEITVFNPNQFGLIVAEEVLHQLGIDHPIDIDNTAPDVCLEKVGKFNWITTPTTDKNTIFKNLMLYNSVNVDDKNVGEQRKGSKERKLSPDQLNEASENIDRGKVNGEAMEDQN